MDKLASCHLAYGFLNVGGRRAGRRHPTAPNCQNLKSATRSLSLADRRGLVSPMKSTSRGLISPPFTASQRFTDEADVGSISKMHDMQMVMGAMDSRFGGGMDPMGEVFLPMRGRVNLAASMVRGGGSRSRTASARPTFLRRERNGELLISMRYLPQSATLNVSIPGARDLRRNADDHVKLRLMHQGIVVKERMGSIAYSANANFNEQLSLPLPTRADNESDTNLIVAIARYDLLNGDEELGHVILGPLGSRVGYRQWRDVMGNPGSEISTWHRLSSRW